MKEAPARAAPLQILVVDDEQNIRVTLSLCLEAEGHTVVTASNIQDALSEAGRHAFDLVFLDLRLGMDNGLDYLPRLLKENPWASVVVITAYASVETAVEAMKRGAMDYLPKPFTPAQVELVTRKVGERRQLERKVETLQATLGAMDPEYDLPTASVPMRAATELARRVAPSAAPLIVRGEVGTGKGRLARAIHAWSGRAGGPFAVVSCRSTHPADLNNELFGRMPREVAAAAGNGDAIALGKVAMCDGGTLVLDGVADLPAAVQPGVVRLVRDHEYERAGDATPRKSNVRVIATTDVDLQEQVRRGTFRPDLLLALDVVQIDIPPLRDRPDDVRLLAERYLAHFGREYGRKIAGFTRDAAHALATYPWPGNARELRNLVERAVLLCGSEQIDLEHFPPGMLNTGHPHAVGDLVPLDTIEELHIRGVVKSTRSLRSAASILGIDSATLFRRMKRYRI